MTRTSATSKHVVLDPAPDLFPKSSFQRLQYRSLIVGGSHAATPVYDAPRQRRRRPLAARAQQGSTLPTIGFLHGSQARSETVDALIQGLKDAGYIERRTSERRQKSGLGAEYTKTA
jgi:hypothetical protein